MTLQRKHIAIGLAVALCLPFTVVADDHGQHGGSGHGSVSNNPVGDDHGQDGNTGDDHGGTVNNGGAEHGDDHGAAGNPAPVGGNNGAPASVDVQFQRTRVSLAQTAAGAAIGAEGHVDLRVQAAKQRLSIEIEANVPDRTMFTLTANSTVIGALTIALGEAEFEFESENGLALAGGLMPAAITSITVSDSSNNAVLQAQFGAISSATPPLPPVLAIHKQVSLTASTLGAGTSAEGTVDLRSQGADTRLRVEVEAKVADGTVWTVSANNGTKLGTVTFKLMEAELQLETADLLQAGVTDPSSITSIQVSDAGANLVLSGTL